MFSLHVQNCERTRETGSGAGRALLGKLLGFAAGLAMAFAFDAVVLHHAVKISLFRNDWGIARVAHGVVALCCR